MKKYYLYRIYTENRNLYKLQKQLDMAFDAYTIIECTGSYKGQHEASIIVELIVPHDKLLYTDAYVSLFCDYTKKLNAQECVMVTVSEIQMSLI